MSYVGEGLCRSAQDNALNYLVWVIGNGDLHSQLERCGRGAAAAMSAVPDAIAGFQFDHYHWCRILVTSNHEASMARPWVAAASASIGKEANHAFGSFSDGHVDHANGLSDDVCYIAAAQPPVEPNSHQYFLVAFLAVGFVVRGIYRETCATRAQQGTPSEPLLDEPEAGIAGTSE